MGVESLLDGIERRRFPRYYVNLRSLLHGPSGAVAVWTVDLSGNGARIGLGLLDASTFEGPGWSLDMPGVGCFPVQRRWHRGNTFGLSLSLSDVEQELLSHDLRLRFDKQVWADILCI